MRRSWTTGQPSLPWPATLHYSALVLLFASRCFSTRVHLSLALRRSRCAWHFALLRVHADPIHSDYSDTNMREFFKQTKQTQRNNGVDWLLKLVEHGGQNRVYLTFVGLDNAFTDGDACSCPSCGHL